jgi:ABC-type multidrug transport system fused ATPase/permease subunit
MPIKPDQLSRADFSPTYKGVELEIPDELPRRILPLFWMFARPFKWPILWQLLMSVTLFVIISMQIYAAKNIADTAMTVDTNNPQAFWLVFEPFKLMLFMFALSVCAEWGSWFGTYRGRIKMLSRARQIVFSYVQRHNVTYFDDMLTGKVAHRVMLMPEQIVTLYERVCWDYLPFLVQSTVTLALFYQVRPAIAGLVGLWLVVYMFLSLRMGRRIARYGAKHSDARAQMTGRIVDSITNIRNVVYFAAEATEDRIVTQSVRDTFKAQRRQYREYIRMRIVMQQLMQGLVYCGVFPLVIAALAKGEMSSGEFVMLIALVLNLLRSLMNISNSLPETYDIIGSVNESIATLVVPRVMTDAPDATALVVKQAEVRLENVCFSYNQWKPVFSGLTLTIPAGQRVGLIGSSGAGKTTLVGPADASL